MEQQLWKNMINNIFLYIDPGTTSALLAGIVGALVGVGMYIKTKWYSIKYRNKTKKWLDKKK
mgnify:CR=1 FL=1